MNSDSQRERTPRLIPVGGFLASGKTTAVARLGAWYKQSGASVGIITTGAGGASVDAIRLRHSGFEVEQIAAEEPAAIAEAVRRLRAGIVLMEASGGTANLLPVLDAVRSSGTDVAPLSVLADPSRAAKILGLDGNSRFSEKVGYLYRRQIEEGSIGLLQQPSASAGRKNSALRNALERRFTNASWISLGKSDDDLSVWTDCLKKEAPRAEIPPADMSWYRQGVAALGALTSAVNLSSVKYFDANKLLSELAGVIQTLLQQEAIEIAHLKMIFTSADSGEAASAHIIGNESTPELQLTQTEPTQRGRLTLNLRAEGDPELLHSAVNRAILASVEKHADLFARMEETLHFRPEASAKDMKQAASAQA